MDMIILILLLLISCYLLPSKENFLNFYFRDIDTFLAGTSENNMLYVKKSIFLVHTFILYGKSEKSYVNVRYAFKIITSIIESSKGKIDGLFVQFLGFLISQFQSKEKLNKEYTSAIVELVKK